jgi:hypothetical protein
MKNKLSFFLFVSVGLFFNNLSAQPNNVFPDSTAFWIDQIEDVCGDPGGCCGGLYVPCSWLTVACYKYRMSGNTLLNGKTYKKIFRSENIEEYYPCYIPDTGGLYFWERYFAGLREDSSKIYILFDGSTTEYLLYDFSVQLGDTTETFSLPNSGYNVYFVYDSTFVDSIWGHQRNIRRMTGFTFVNGNFNFNYTDYWIEGIGSLKGFIWLQYNNFYKNRSCLGAYSELKDFSLIEDSLKYQCRDSIFMEPPFYVNTDEEQLNNLLSVYPNPTENNIILNISDEHAVSTIHLTNLQGKTLKRYQGFQKNIPVTDLSNGLYFLHVQFANGETVVKKIMKQ